MKKIIPAVFIIIALFTIFSISPDNRVLAAASANMGGVYEIINQENLLFFEQEIAKEEVISNIPPKKLARLAEYYGVEENKLKFLICLKFMLDKYGYSYDLSELCGLPDNSVSLLTFAVYARYWSELTDVEKAEINEKTKDLNLKF